MNLLQEVQKLAIKKNAPKIRPGDTVRVHQRIKEGEKERVQIFEGLVIRINSGHGADKSFTVRRIVGGFGVEKIFPLHSTNIVKIEIKKRSKVRRSKLYYMRDRSGKSARLKGTFISEKDLEESIEELAEEKEKEEAEKAVEEGETAAEDSDVQTEAEKQEEEKAEEKPKEEAKEEPEAEEKAEDKKE